MQSPKSVKALEQLGRVRLSPSFFMRDFLYSEIAALHGIANVPDDPELAIAAGTQLCEQLLEPLQECFGRIAIRSGFRCEAVNSFGNLHGHNCAQNHKSFAGHIWDRRNAAGQMGATACIVVIAAIPYYECTRDWQALAWWVHDHLPYDQMEFFPRYAAFNLGWHEAPRREIWSYIPPRRGKLTAPGLLNWQGDHSALYAAMLRDLAITAFRPARIPASP